MKVVRTIAELETVPGTGLVPTMGAFHDGHRALFRAARAENDRVVVSLFVNPAQFDERTDLDAYPRDEAGDLAIAEREEVDVGEVDAGRLAVAAEPVEQQAKRAHQASTVSSNSANILEILGSSMFCSVR